VQRLLFALILAVFLHTILVFVYFSGKTTVPPRLAGEKSITISLSTPATPEIPVKQPRKEEKKKDSIKPEKVKTVSKNVAQEIAPVTLRARATKRIRHTTSSISKTTTALPQDSAIPEKPGLQAAAPISVKASPLYAENPKPEYPALARRRNWQGTVIISVSVSKKGAADRVELQKSSGYVLLDKAALQAVASWRFLPGTEAGHPVAMKVLIPVHFKMQ